MAQTKLCKLQKIVQLADDIQHSEPRIAFLCRAYAHRSAEELESSSAQQLFLTSQQLLLEDDYKSCSEISDLRVFEAFFGSYYKTHIGDHVGEAHSAQLDVAYRTTELLFGVLLHLCNRQVKKLTSQTQLLLKDLETKWKSLAPYNILPLDRVRASHPIRQLEEVEATVLALRTTEHMKLPQLDGQAAGDSDILDWLRVKFGFQTDNVRNQRENLILLLVNLQTRLHPKPVPLNKLDDRAVDALMEKLFTNYKFWCKYLGKDNNLDLQPSPCSQQQLKLVYMGLYLLIWGEAANVRLIPECLCYIFHQMAEEIVYLLVDRENKPLLSPTNREGMVDRENKPLLSPTNREGMVSNADGDFLSKVITPLYRVIEKEAKNSKHGKVPYSSWSNYDDLNEYFWDSNCFSLGWPLCLDDDFFQSTLLQEGQGSHKKWGGKSYFVETRSFFHIFRSFARMWKFYVLAFLVMVNIAWEGTNFHPWSICIADAWLSFSGGMLELYLNFQSYRRSQFTRIVRIVLKMVVSFVWAIGLGVFYAHSQYMWSLAGLYFLPYAVTLISFIPMFQCWVDKSECCIIRYLQWWWQEKVYVGRGMYESQFAVIKYSLFWMILLFFKFAFSYFFQIKPMVKPTKDIMSIQVEKYSWHDFFPMANHSYEAVVLLWAPVILVYFMDTQIWYALLSTLCGCIVGALEHIGEIRSLRMLRSRFQSLPDAFNRKLVHCDSMSSSDSRSIEVVMWPQLWNGVVESFREEDLISDRELSLMLVHHPSIFEEVIQWPLFLLAGKIPVALDMAAEFQGTNSTDLWKSICADEFMRCAVQECYKSFIFILHPIISADSQSFIITLSEVIKQSISNDTFHMDFKLGPLSGLCKRFEELLENLLDPNSTNKTKTCLIRDIFRIITHDMMVIENCEVKDLGNLDPRPKGDITHPLEWDKQVKRLFLIFSLKETDGDVPSNHEARRRITFFTNSLFMNMPCAPRVREMLPFSIMTPYYNEETVFSRQDIMMENEDGVSIAFYLQRIFPDEWVNFLERIRCSNDSDCWKSEVNVQKFCQWVSLRGQTLFRTVRGMMYNRKALMLQAFFDTATITDIQEGRIKPSAQLEALVDLKFTYVVACQNYGGQMRDGDHRAMDISNLLIKNPSLRVAYIDEVEETVSNEEQKVYYSVLVKAVGNFVEEIYRIKLPGPAIVGEGKPENQNHAIVFTRGEALQTIDMNQDNYFEEALKMRNLLEEFNKDPGVRPPTILGVREHIFTGSVSSLAWFMSNQEMAFVTICQRVMARPLKVRFHYGHPDVFDRIFHITCGGISKASRGINLSEDIFAGFNSTLRGGNVTHHEYIQVGKGRDVGLNQISLFEAKVACGNGEQMISRDIYRLGHHFDFFRMMSCYFTTVGFFVNLMIVVLILYVFLYGKLYLSLSGLEEIIMTSAVSKPDPLKVSMAAQSIVQIGLLLALPLTIEIGLERGFRTGIGEFILMQLQLASVFFAFSLGTRVHYFGRTLLHGGAKYRSTGRGFVIHHVKFADNYRMYSRSHYVKGLELMMLLMVYKLYGTEYENSVAYILLTFSMWFLVVSWLFGPSIFNPLGFEWLKIVEDWDNWAKWINNQGGIGVPATKCWLTWWDEEHKALHDSGFFGSFLEILLSLRFLLYQYGIVYHLHVAHGDTSITVYGLSWLVIIATLTMVKFMPKARRRFGALNFRFLKLILATVFAIILICLFAFLGLTVGDVFASLLAFIPAVWAILQICLACEQTTKKWGMWTTIRTLSRSYDYMMGTFIFAPIAVLAWFPFISEFQTRLLFNQAFSRGLQIRLILGGHKKYN